MKYYLLLLIILLPVGTAQSSGADISVGSDTCNIPDTSGRQYIAIRGTGYFWIEHIYRGFPNDQQLVLLIQGNNPIFSDRASISNEGNKCSDQKIVSFAWLPDNNINHSVNFDCHITDDQPYQPGEIVFGILKDNEVGFQQPTLSWRAFVKPFGKGGEIEQVNNERRVFCTNLPGID